MILLAVAIGLLTTGSILSYMERRTIKLDVNTWPPLLGENIFYKKLHQSMLMSMEQYQDDALHRDAWDTIQLRFNCCGIATVKDWIKVTRMLPKSCCINVIILNLKY